MTTLALDATSFLLFRTVRGMRLFCLFNILANRKLVVRSKILWLAAIYFMPGLAVPAYFFFGGRPRDGLQPAAVPAI